MRRNFLGKYPLSRTKILLSLVVLVCLGLFITSQTAFAASDYEFVTEWGSNGTGDGQFGSPYGVAVDSSGNIYVADRDNDRIQKFDSSGTFVSKWGSSGTGDGQFNAPYDIAIDSSGNIYIADGNNHRIQKFDSSGTFLSKWGKNGGDGTSGTGDGEFNWPTNIAIDASDNIYVVDYYNYRVQKFDSSGTFATKWGSNGSGDGQFDYPFGIAIDSSNNIYVTDRYNDRVQKFDSSGTFLSKFGTNGTGDGQFDKPYDIAIDSSGNIFVADANNHRVQKFDSSGTFATKWGKNDGDGTSGTGDGEFNQPTGIAIDSSGKVYVADKNNHRMQKFARTDASFVAADKAWLTFDQIKNSNASESEITSDLNLMTSAPNGSTVFWGSNNESVIGTDGTVNRPAYGNSDAGVILTATLTKGSAADTVTFNLNVKASTDTPTPTPTTPTATSFTDVPSTAWYKTYVDTLVSQGIISGYADNTFRPNTYVTRAEFSKMLTLAMGWTTTGTATSSFPDVAATDWSSPYVEAAKTNGALSGYPDGTFGPNKTITRAEIAVVIARVKGLASVAATFTDTTGHWANGEIGACSNAGILSGYTDGTFRPDGSATRAEAAKLIAALL